MIGTIVDITKQKNTEQELVDKIKELNEANAKIELMSRIDYLTQIANRRAFIHRLKDSVAMAQRHKTPLCLIMMDLDFFKKINDKYGHDTGDAVLINFAQVLKETCREEDFPARNGGEEFYIITPMTNLENAEVLAKRIQDKVRKSKVNGISFTVSMGISQYIDDEGISSFLKRVAQTMYKAKDGERNKIVMES